MTESKSAAPWEKEKGTDWLHRGTRDPVGVMEMFDVGCGGNDFRGVYIYHSSANHTLKAMCYV